VLWAVFALVVIALGFPVTAWVVTRGLARRPLGPLAPYRGRAEKWIHKHYGVDWPGCSLIQKAVAQGSRVADPVLEDAAHRLAAATLARKVPAARLLYVAAAMNIVLGLFMASFGIGSLFWVTSRFQAVFLIFQGVWFFTLGWIQYKYGVGRQRKNAFRALELNRVGPASGA
jgi:hypothetical protein